MNHNDDSSMLDDADLDAVADTVVRVTGCDGDFFRGADAESIRDAVLNAFERSDYAEFGVRSEDKNFAEGMINDMDFNDLRKLWPKVADLKDSNDAMRALIHIPVLWPREP